MGLDCRGVLNRYSVDALVSTCLLKLLAVCLTLHECVCRVSGAQQQAKTAPRLGQSQVATGAGLNASLRHSGCAARLTPPLTSLPPAGDDAAERLRAHCSFTTCQRCDGGRPLYRASRRRAKPRSALSTRGHTHLERFETTNWARRVAMQCGRESHV